MNAPSQGRPARFRYPRRTKIIVVAVLALAAAGFTLAFMTYDSGVEPDAAEVSGPGGDGQGAPGRVVDPEVQVNPPRDAPVVQRQETIVLQLEPGWAAELELRQAGRDTVPLPADEVDVTPLNQYIYVPGDGKALARLPDGRTCIRYTAWSRVEGRAASEITDEWCFSVV